MLRSMPDMERALGRLRNNAAAPAPGLPDWAIQAAQKRWDPSIGPSWKALLNPCFGMLSWTSTSHLAAIYWGLTKEF